MSRQPGKSAKPFPRLWQRVKNRILQEMQDVPKGDAVCEFDCRKGQCTLREWKKCDRRVQADRLSRVQGQPPPL